MRWPSSTAIARWRSTPRPSRTARPRSGRARGWSASATRRSPSARTPTTRRDEALAERDTIRAQRDELLLAHQALQAQLHAEWGEEDRAEPLAGAPPSPAPPSAEPSDEFLGEQPLGVRKIPRARTVAASLHRSQREREHVVTRYDMWAIRILGSVAALAFISLLVMILKAFFVF